MAGTCLAHRHRFPSPGVPTLCRTGAIPEAQREHCETCRVNPSRTKRLMEMHKAWDGPSRALEGIGSQGVTGFRNSNRVLLYVNRALLEVFKA
jgi:hypothetical protein